MVRAIYEKMGFTALEDGQYLLTVSEYKEQPIFITEGN